MTWQTTAGPAQPPMYEYTGPAGDLSIACDDRGMFLRHPDGSEVTWAEYQAAESAESAGFLIDPAAFFTLDFSVDPYVITPVVVKCDCGSAAAGLGPGVHSTWCSVAEVRA